MHCAADAISFESGMMSLKVVSCLLSDSLLALLNADGVFFCVLRVDVLILILNDVVFMVDVLAL